MSGTISGLFFPSCALLFSILLSIIYFSKKKIDLKENKLYSVMVLSILFDNLFVLILQIVANTGINEIEFFGVFFNKLDFICLITYAVSIFVYVLFVTVIGMNDNYKKVIKYVYPIYILIICIVIISPLNMLSNGQYKSISGAAANITFATVGILIFISFIITIIHYKNINKKHLPILIMPFLLAMLLILYLVNPYFVIISIILTFVNYIMYFTIENPDVRLLEEISKSRDLSEKYNNDKSKFIFNMTQQIRYPLNLIEQKIDLIKDSNDIHEIKEQNDQILTSVKRISNIINNSLNIESIDSNKIKLYENKYNIKNMINEIDMKTESLCAKKNIEFILNIDDGLPTELYGDYIRLKQVITSLLDNSIKYTDVGFIELNINYIIQYDVCRLIISIKDSGKGIPLDEIDKLFNNTNLEKALDYDDRILSLVEIKKIINLIGGTITVGSEKNKGAEITITIDQKIKIEQDEISNMVVEYKNINNKRKILFISDNVQESNFYKKRLSNGYDIETTKNGEEGLKKIRLKKIRNHEKYD